MDDKFQKAVFDYYRQQSGGNFPIYRGTDLQYGNGFGDIFRSIGRFLLPILAPVASQFISSTAQNLSEGRNLREAARAAVNPTISEALSATGSQIMSRIPQRGSGRRGRPKRNSLTNKQGGSVSKRRVRKAMTKKRTKGTRKVYKGVGNKRRAKSSNINSLRKFPRILNTNF